MCVLSGLLRWKKWVFIFDYLNGFLVAVDCPKFINHTPYNWVPIIHQSHECFQFQQAHNALEFANWNLENSKFALDVNSDFGKQDMYLFGKGSSTYFHTKSNIHLLVPQSKCANPK